MAVSERNRVRFRHMLMSRSYKEFFAGSVPRGWLYNWLFRGENGEIRVVGEQVLADLRDFCGVSHATIFDPDPIVMARREGRREVAVRIINFLNLDEAKVQQLMELDDGL